MKILSVLAVVATLTLAALVASFQAVGTISTASNPSYGAYYNGEVYFIAQGAGELQVIEDNQIVSTIKLPSYPNPFSLAILNGTICVVFQKGPYYTSYHKSYIFISLI